MIRLKISLISFTEAHPQNLTAIESLRASAAMYLYGEARAAAAAECAMRDEATGFELRIYLQAITFSTFRRTY